MRTQVGIVGAGPAGLLLSHLLHLQGIDSVVLEARSRHYVENRIRAGVLEWGTEQLLADSGVGDRMRAEGLPHEGVRLRVDQQDHRIDFRALTGKHVLVYSQHKVVQDLIAARLAAGGQIVFEADNVAVHDIRSDTPGISYEQAGTRHRLDCAIIAGCDGFHGICRDAIPPGILRIFERDYPFAWLGILANAPPSSEELVYASGERGFALLSMRSPTVSRLYLQCPPDEDLEAWSDDRIWAELQARLARDGFTLTEGEITQKGITAMRSFVVEPMQYGRLFLAGDAAHIVPPTGAKGLNLAIADVVCLADALTAHYGSGDRARLESYSDRCLARVWRAQYFSWWMTQMLHRDPRDDAYGDQLSRSQILYVCNSRAAAASLAENYVGLPFETPLGG